MENPMDPVPAESALSLLFGKLHPLLEDAAHLQVKRAGVAEFRALQRRLQAARDKVSEQLDGLAGATEEEDLAALLDALSANLTPMGEPLQQGLVLTQLCLEEAPKDLLPFVPSGRAGTTSWGRRMVGFLQRLEDPAFQARQRWRGIDPDLGDEIEG